MIAVALLALALFVPGTLYPPSDVSHAVFRVAVCLAACGTLALPRGRLVRWGLALWAAGIALSVMAAPDMWRAIWSTHNRQEGAWQVAHYLVLALAAGAASRSMLPRWVAVVALASATWGVFSFGWVNGRLAGSTGNPLYLAPLLLIGVWGAWTAAEDARTGIHNVYPTTWRAVAAILALAAFATGSKGVLVAAVAAGGVLALRKAPWVSFVLAAGLAAALQVVHIPASGLIRLELGRVALHGIARFPLAGWGAEGFPFVWDTFWRGVSATGEAWHDRAHCLPLDRAIEWGLVGVAGWIMVVIAAWHRAELPERAAIAAYVGYSLTMFEMMWGAAGFAVLLGYVLRGKTVAGRHSRNLAIIASLCALVVGSLQLAQSRAAATATTMPEMQAAIEQWSPVGGDVIELYLKAPQTRATLEWAAGQVETHSPHATQQAFLLAAWDRTYCVDLRLAAPWRPDVRALCDFP